MAFSPNRRGPVPALLALLFTATPLLAQQTAAANAVGRIDAKPVHVSWEARALPETAPVTLRAISLRLDEVSLEAALHAIAERAGVELTYSPESLVPKQRVSAHVSEVDALAAFALVLEGTGLVAIPTTSQRVVITTPPPVAPARPGSEVRQGTISGRVTEGASGRPLSGTQVTIVGTSLGGLSAADGSYTISGVPAGAQRVRASRIGFAAQEVSVSVTTGQSSTVDFALEPQALELEGVVAVGYGTQARRDITGSIGSVTAEQLEKAPLATMSQALQGRVAGVQVTQNSAAPGGGFSVRIRGSGSLSSDNEPLFVVDGVPVGKSSGNALGAGVIHGRQDPSSLSFLNPQDIESIEVLKDASATAIYGSRGSNGVVLITTKSGRTGETLMDVESSYGIQEISKRYDLLNSVQYAEFANELYRLQGAASVPFPNPQAVGAGTDWQSQILRSAPMMQHNVNLRGGVGQTRFSLSGGYTDEQGIVKRTGFERYNFHGSVDHAVSSRLDVGSTFTAARTNTQFGAAADGYAEAYASAMQAALVTWPFLPVRGDDGQYLYMDIDVPESLRALGWNAGRGYENAVAAINEVTDEMEQDRLLGSAFVNYQLLDGLDLRVSGGADVLRSTRNSYYTRNTRVARTSNGIAQSGTVDASNFVGESILRYSANFGDMHGLELTTGMTVEKSDGSSRSMSNRNFVTDHLGYWGLDDGVIEGGPEVGIGSSESTLQSYIGRANYDYAGKYLLTVTSRYDGSSRFGAANKWGFFPSAALGWRLSEEPFLRDLGWLSDLKLRASYGETGNQEIGNYQSLSRLGSGEYAFGGVRAAGFFPSSIANSALHWERSRMMDAGVDAAFLDNRLFLTFDYYRRTTDDLLFSLPLPMESGFGSVLTNVGSIENKGVELALGADLIDGERFGWNVAANISANRNQVLRIGGGTTQFFGGQLTSAGAFAGDKSGNLVREGEPLGVFYGYRIDGMFRDDADVAAYVNAEGLPIMPGALPGQPKYVDVDGDGVITSADRTILGNPEPDFLLGFTNDLRVGPLSLHGFFQGSVGNDVYNLMLQEIAQDRPSVGSNVYAPRYFERWTPENPDAAWPRLAVPAGQGYNGAGDVRDLYIEDGSYLRLKSLVLTYELPESLGQRVLPGTRSTQLYLNAQNLFTWSGYSGINPDVNSQGDSNINRGIDFGSYPLPRTYRVGVRLGL